MKRFGILLLILLAVLALLCAGAAADEEDVASFGEFSGSETVNAELRGDSRTPSVFFSKLY